MRFLDILTHGKSYEESRKSSGWMQYTLASRTEKIKQLVEKCFSQNNNNKLVAIDIGCADGLMSQEIASMEEVKYVVGIECSTSFKFEHPAKKIAYLYGDGYALPVKKQRVNLALLSACFKHVPDADKLIQEIKGQLDSKGFVIICEPRPFILRLFTLLGHFDKRWLHNVWTLKEYEEFFDKYGFNKVRDEYYMPPFKMSRSFETFLGRLFGDFIYMHQVGMYRLR